LTPDNPICMLDIKECAKKKGLWIDEQEEQMFQESFRKYDFFPFYTSTNLYFYF